MTLATSPPNEKPIHDKLLRSKFEFSELWRNSIAHFASEISE